MPDLDDLVIALDADDTVTSVTSVRQPAALRSALQIAVELGLAPTVNEATNRAVRDRLEAFAQRRALDEHYALHPDVRPALHEVAHALAVLDGSPLAERVDLLRQAAAEVVEHRPDADADDVLLWATSLLRHAPARTRKPRSA